MKGGEFLDGKVEDDIELFIREDGDLPTIAEEKVDSLGQCLEEISKPKKRHRTASESSRLRQIERTRSFPGTSGSLRTSSMFMRSSRYLQRYRITNETHSDNLSNVLSGLYAMFLVVVGASIPLAKVFAVEITVEIFEGFYLYLFIVGIAFITFVYVVLRYDVNPIRYLKKHMAHRTAKCNSGPPLDRALVESEEAGETSSSLQRSTSEASEGFESTAFYRRSMNFSFKAKSGSESFYLRLGAVAFGIGSVIHNGLEFGQFLEMKHSTQCDVDLVIILRPIIQLIFTFMQLYFIFINSKLCIHNYCAVGRFGTMHLIATNLCVWLRVITIETVREIQRFVSAGVMDLLGDENHSGHASGSSSYAKNNSSLSDTNTYEHHKIPHKRAAAHHPVTDVPLMAMVTDRDNLSCQETSLMAQLLNSASTYLYPCTIEYCLIAAAIMFLMWNSIDQPPPLSARNSIASPGTTMDFPLPQFSKRNQVSVDCSGANRGLFGGIFILVLTVISIIIFFIFIDNPHHVRQAIIVEHVSLIALYSLALVAVAAAAFRFRDLAFRRKRDRRLDETLLVLSLIGVYMFRIFSSIAGHLSTEIRDGSLILATNVIITLQATVQTVFILNGLRRRARTLRQETRKPGREYVTFLLICNISIWAANTFEVLRSDANPVSLSFYGPVSWSIITHVATPLTIFHQFHATVCLSTIWKTAYKLKKD